MTKYLLDSDIVSSWSRRRNAQLANRMLAQEPGSLCASVIVAAELRYGLHKRGGPVLTRQVEEALDLLVILPFAPPADDTYGQIRTALERAGTPIGANDMLIAAHALALDLTLVTGNAREFRRVPSLRVENWLEPQARA